MSAAPPIGPGDTVADRYRISRVLGEGGMGVVYAAEHMLMRKEVALKVLHGEMCTMPEIVARFEREAVAAAAIDHPNVAGATDFGRLPDGACYLVLELLKGTSLRDEIEKGPMSLDRALIIFRGIVNGVAAAHAKGIVHRDLKPENVMLVDREGVPDFVKVLDFGIAKMDANVSQPLSEGQKIVTRVGTIFGTPEYMAPEQAVGDKVDARADIFALGVVFLEMLTGECPFKGEILNVLRDRILMTSMPDMSAIESEGARALITKMLQRHADDRVQSANDLLAAIDALEAPPPAVAKSIVTEETTPNPSSITTTSLTAMLSSEKRPRWVVPAAIAAAASLVVIIVAFSATGSDPSRKDQPRHVAAKHGPPTPTAIVSVAPAVAPSASVAEPEPEPEPTPAPSASHTPAAPTRPAKKPAQRKTGPGGIYVPPIKDWFK